MNKASGLNPVVAAIVLCNTVYRERAVQRLKPHRQSVDDTLLTHLSPLDVANSEHYAPSGVPRGGEATFKSLAYDFFRFVSRPLIRVGYSYKWTGFGEYKDPSPEGKVVQGKTLWDWLDLLIIPITIPLTLALVGYVVNSAQEDRDNNLSQQRIQEDRRIADERIQEDRRLAEDRTQETALQTYLDDMASLLIDKKLSSKPITETKQIARVWTLTTMRRLNGERNRIALQFLLESRLIQGGDPIVSLINTDLSGIDFTRAKLQDADLSGADLSGADLSGANLKGADLHGANLSMAKLSGAKLSGANLTGAKLSGAKCTKETKWPDGFDVAQAGAILVESPSAVPIVPGRRYKQQHP